MIKFDISLPKSCEECPFQKEDKFYGKTCAVNYGTNAYYNEERPLSCPIEYETNGERFLKAFPGASVVNYNYGDYDKFEVFVDNVSFMISKEWWNALT